jgi:energy-coupling factor transporter ATP-binding protein EcfA2
MSRRQGWRRLIVQDIFKVIVKMRDEGKTVLLVEQNAKAALQVADRGYVLKQAKSFCRDLPMNCWRTWKSNGPTWVRIMVNSMTEKPDGNVCIPEERSQQALERLQSTLNRAYRNVPFHQQRLQKEGIDPSDIQSLDDVQRLPFTTRKHLSENYPYGLFAVPLRDIVRIHTAPGTSVPIRPSAGIPGRICKFGKVWWQRP